MINHAALVAIVRALPPHHRSGGMRALMAARLIEEKIARLDSDRRWRGMSAVLCADGFTMAEIIAHAPDAIEIVLSLDMPEPTPALPTTREVVT